MYTNEMQRWGRSPGRLVTVLCAALFSLLALAISAPRAQAQLTTLYNFGADITYPYASPPVYNSNDGYLYGLANTGGSGYGGIYKIKPGGTGYQVVYSFQNGTDGAYPQGPLTFDSVNNVFYGCVQQASSSTFTGAIFKFDGTSVTEIFTFPGSDADGPFPEGVVLGTDGALYGTGGGVVFRLNTDGSGFQTVLLAHTGAFSAPVQGANNIFYAIDTNGNIVSFSYSSGALSTTLTNVSSSTTLSVSLPYTLGSSPAVGTDGNLYGTANAGGASGLGGLWKYNVTTGAVTDIYDFTGGADGSNPFGGMAIDSAGNLYTLSVAESGYMSLVEYNRATATLTTLDSTADFWAGGAAMGSVYIDPLGRLFVTSRGSGSNEEGALFVLLGISGVVSPAPNAAGWNTTLPTLAITASSAILTIKHTTTRNGVTGRMIVTQGTSNVVTINSDGVYSVSYYGTDTGGNATSLHTTAINVDTTPPVTYMASEDNLVFLDGTDATSGVAATYYTVDGGSQQTYTTYFEIPQGSQTHTITYWSVDVAGNVETANVAIIDTRADTFVLATDVPGTTSVLQATTFSANLTETDTNLPIAGQTLTFTMADGTALGAAVTNSSGVATLKVVLPASEPAGTTTFKVAFAGDSTQKPSSDTGNVTIAVTSTTIQATSRGSASSPIPVGTTISPLRAELSAVGGNIPLSGYTINYQMNGTSIGSAVTSGNIASLSSYTIPDTLPIGANTLTVSFAGSGSLGASTGTATYYIGPANTTMTPVYWSGKAGQMVALTATLTSQITRQGLAGKTITFTVKGQTYTATTAANGSATVFYTLPSTKGTFTYTASFAGTSYYNPVSNIGYLTVTK